MAASLSPPAVFSDASKRRALSAAELFELTRAREAASSRLLMAFVTTGLIFMVFPGTFLGVWNLLQISGRESVASISAAWIQARAHEREQHISLKSACGSQCTHFRIRLTEA